MIVSISEFEDNRIFVQLDPQYTAEQRQEKPPGRSLQALKHAL